MSERPKHWWANHPNARRMSACGISLDTTFNPTLRYTPNVEETECLSCKRTVRYKNEMRKRETRGSVPG